MEWATVCSAGEVTELLGVGALVFDHQVAVFKVDGELYAIDNFDPFSQANVLSRGIVGDVKGELVIVSPIYKQHFLLKTGACLEDGTVAIIVHPVRVQDGMVQVALGSPVSQQAA